MAVKDLEQLQEAFGQFIEDMKSYCVEPDNTQRVTTKKLDELFKRMQRLVERVEKIDRTLFTEKKKAYEKNESEKLKAEKNRYEKIKQDLERKKCKIEEQKAIIESFRNGSYVLQSGNVSINLEKDTISKLYFKKLEKANLKKENSDLNITITKLRNDNKKLRKKLHHAEQGRKEDNDKHQDKLRRKDEVIKKLKCDYKSLHKENGNLESDITSKSKELIALKSKIASHDHNLILTAYETREKWTSSKNQNLRTLYRAIPEGLRLKVKDIDTRQGNIRIVLTENISQNKKNSIKEILEQGLSVPYVGFEW